MESMLLQENNKVNYLAGSKTTLPKVFPYNAKTPTGGRECLRFSYEGEIVIRLRGIVSQAASLT